MKCKKNKLFKRNLKKTIKHWKRNKNIVYFFQFK